jgi:hypothetical protein
MTNPQDLAQFGSIFDQQLMDAIAAQEPEVAQRLLAELHAGNYEISVDGTPPVITIRIAGAIVLEAQVYRQPDDVQNN